MRPYPDLHLPWADADDPFASLTLLCALCVDRPAAASGPATADFLLPRTFSERTKVADLQGRFGKANVKVIEASSRDEVRSVVLFPDDPTRRAYLAFHDVATLTGLRSISVRDAGSLWRGKHSVHIGMSFAELRKRNGKPFFFTGFDNERRGSAHDQPA